MYKVSEFAKLFHINSSVLRYYDREGIFSPEYRDAKTGYRYYTARQIYSFSNLLSARDMGLPLDEMKNSRDAASFFDDTFVRMTRRHDQLEIFLRDLDALREPKEHRIFTYTHPSFFAVKRDFVTKHTDLSWDILSKAALELIRENIPLEYAHASHLIYHDTVFPHTIKKVTCCLSVKPSDHPWIEEVPKQRYVCIYHYGPADNVATAYRLLHAYIDQRNLEVSGPLSERYIRKTTEPGSANKILREIRFPLRTRR